MRPKKGEAKSFFFVFFLYLTICLYLPNMGMNWKIWHINSFTALVHYLIHHLHQTFKELLIKVDILIVYDCTPWLYMWHEHARYMRGRHEISPFSYFLDISVHTFHSFPIKNVKTERYKRSLACSTWTSFTLDNWK